MSLHRNIFQPMLAAGLLGLCLFVAAPLGFSKRLRHSLRRAIAKTQLALYRRGHQETKLVSLSGATGTPGAEVQVLDSVSGWATLCDRNGQFTLPDVQWYPRAEYDLLISSDYERARKAIVLSSDHHPEDWVVRTGKLTVSEREVAVSDTPGAGVTSFERYDFNNRDFYRSLYEGLTQDKKSDAENVDAVNKFVAQRLNYSRTKKETPSPRDVIERGSEYCGHLAEAFAAIIAQGYPVRILDLRDARPTPATHVVAEVFYQDGWHLYDPTYGVRFLGRNGEVVSYRDLRLDPKIVSTNSFTSYEQRYPKTSLDWMPGVYGSGYHHFYKFSFQCAQYGHAWCSYENGLDYVPLGGRLLLGAAGLQPGSHVTYHIRSPGSPVDLITLTTTNKANSVCVLNQEESPPINLAPGDYEVAADFHDGNVPKTSDVSELVLNWHLGGRLKVR